MAERDAQVVRLGGEEAERSKTAPTATSRQPLDPDLERVLGVLTAAGLDPKVLAVRPNRRGVSRAS